MNQTKYILCFSFLLLGLNMSSQNQLKSGTWRAVLTLDSTGTELPFNFDVSYVTNKPLIEIRNADEKIPVTEITIVKDSVSVMMPVFDTELKARLSHDTLIGYWINHTKKENNKIPFKAYHGEKNRFIAKANPTADFTGKYEVSFNPKKEDEYKAIGLFKQQGHRITGTFLTETGDYRYLEGIVENNKMSLSCFDGSHAFLFIAESKNKTGVADSLLGKVFYGISGTEEWTATRNEAFELKDPESITYLKDPNQKIEFSFPNISKQNVTLNDEKFKNKVVIIQIMGTWCPNCMDETAYFSKLYKQYKNKGLEIISLAYERTTDFEKAKNNLLRLKNRFGIEYELLITGLTGKAKASESLPFLSSISAFPTTIILDKKHKVKSIYTGFSGPATGKEYEKYKLKTESLINRLLLQKKQ